MYILTNRSFSRLPFTLLSAHWDMISYVSSIQNHVNIRQPHFNVFGKNSNGIERVHGTYDNQKPLDFLPSPATAQEPDDEHKDTDDDEDRRSGGQHPADVDVGVLGLNVKVRWHLGQHGYKTFLVKADEDADTEYDCTQGLWERRRKFRKISNIRRIKSQT